MLKNNLFYLAFGFNQLKYLTVELLRWPVSFYMCLSTCFPDTGHQITAYKIIIIPQKMDCSVHEMALY